MRNRGFHAVFAAVLLVSTPIGADDSEPTLLQNARGWRGFVEVETRLKADKEEAGEEVLKERVEFFAVTDPAKREDDRPILPLRLGRAKGQWGLKLDLRDPRGAGEVATRGAASGSLGFTLDGVVDLRRNEVRLRFGTRNQRFSVKTTTSGMDTTGFATFRSVALRRSVLDGQRGTAALDESQRKAGNERTFEVKRGKRVRVARIRWSLERLEPEVRGRIVDQHGNPVEGLQVFARTVRVHPRTFVATPVQLEATSGKDGRFRMPAVFGTWGIEIRGRVADGVLTRGWVRADAVRLRFDDVPDLEVEAVTYAFARLPMTRLLETRYRGDVNAFMEYIERRYQPRELARLRLPKPSATN